MATDVKNVLDTLGKMTVLELVELKNAIEEEWGVTAAAPVAVAAAPQRRRRRGRRGGEGLVRRRPHRRRRQEDPGDQGRARGHRPRPQGGQGPRRRRPGRGQGGRREGRGRVDQGPDRGGRGLGRAQVRHFRFAKVPRKRTTICLGTFRRQPESAWHPCYNPATYWPRRASGCGESCSCAILRGSAEVSSVYPCTQ